MTIGDAIELVKAEFGEVSILPRLAGEELCLRRIEQRLASVRRMVDRQPFRRTRGDRLVMPTVVRDEVVELAAMCVDFLVLFGSEPGDEEMENPKEGGDSDFAGLCGEWLQAMDAWTEAQRYAEALGKRQAMLCQKLLEFVNHRVLERVCPMGERGFVLVSYGDGNVRFIPAPPASGLGPPASVTEKP